MELGSVSWKPFRTILVKPVLKSGALLIRVRHMVGHDAFWVEEVTNSRPTVLLFLLTWACFSDLIGSMFQRAEKAVWATCPSSSWEWCTWPECVRSSEVQSGSLLNRSPGGKSKGLQVIPFRIFLMSIASPWAVYSFGWKDLAFLCFPSFFP